MLHKFFYFFIIILTVQTWAAADVSVELEWESLPDAESYELEVIDKSGKVVRNVRSKTPTIKFKVPVGNYTLRWRALDSRGVPGNWADPEKIEVAPPTPKLVQQDGVPSKVVVNASQKHARIPLKWEAIASAEEYEVEIKDKSGKVQRIKTKNPEAELDLVPGQFQYRLIAKSNGFRSEPTKWSKKIEVISTPLTPPQIPEFSENGAPDFIQIETPMKDATIEFEVERKRHFDNEWKPIDKKMIQIVNGKLDLTQWEAGLYRVKFWTKLDGWPDSAKVERLFIAKPTEDRIQSHFDRENVD